LILVVVGFVAVASAYWPGIMIDDARWQYQQSVDNAYEDWHPPLMAWVWHLLMAVKPGPAPMLLLQLSFYWSGIALIAIWLFREGRPRSSLAIALAGWLPAVLALSGSVTKDALMNGALVLAVALLLWRQLAKSTVAQVGAVGGAMLALLVASALRVNAFFACAPLGLAAIPPRFTRTPFRLIVATALFTAAFAMVPGMVAKVLDAEDTDAQLSLIIFDLGGITKHSRVDQFPELHVANPVAVNDRCYNPKEWDGYSTWAQKPCPLGFDAFQRLVDEGDTDPRTIWIQAILNHPVAYAEHRLSHFNLSTWFLVPEGPDFTAWKQSVPNPWNFQVRPSPLLNAIDGVANGAARTPLGWPIFWIALALAVVAGGLAVGLDRVTIWIATSAFAYGMAYAVVGVATGMRYYMWTISGAAIALVLAASELSSAPARRKFSIVAVPIVILPAGLGALSRLVL
jgi:hypothetical protein